MRVRYQIGGPSVPPFVAPDLPAWPPPAALPLRPAPPAPSPSRTRPTPPRPRRRVREGHPARYGIAAVTLIAAAGCASLDPGAARTWSVQPVLKVTHSMASSEGHYRVGRYHDGMGQWDKAIDAYRKAIGADARNVNAQNALGVALAQRGAYVEADAVLRHALALDPARADVRSNLGYVLMLAGRLQAAVTELQAALELDRTNPVALANLREASARAGGVLAVGVQAASPRATAAPVIGPTTVSTAVPSASMQVIDRPTMAWSLAAAAAPALQSGFTAVPPGSATLEAGFAGVLHAPPPSAPQATPAGVPAQAASRADIVLEVSNGNGVTGMGARLRDWLAGQGLRAGRLNNQRPFVQAYTEIQYRAGRAQAAQRVVDALPAALQAAPMLVPGLRSDVRVVLGRDWVRSAACLEHGNCSVALTTMAAAEPTR